MKTIEIESDGHVENKDHTSSHLYILIEGELIAKDEKNEYILKKDNFIYFPKGANHIIINSHTKKAKLIDIVPNDRVGGK
jgi:quercetin dioxygenase-like cupin family protein